jgi:hypothetical protein
MEFILTDAHRRQYPCLYATTSAREHEECCRILRARLTMECNNSQRDKKTACKDIHETFTRLACDQKQSGPSLR